MKNLRLYIGTVCASLMISSCSSDFLDVYPTDQMMSTNYYNNDNEVLMGTAVLYTRPWFDSEENTSMMVGDCRAGVAINTEVNGLRHTWLNTTVAVGPDIERPWKSYYAVNTHACAILDNINKYCKPEVSERVKNQAIGECYFMQSMAYFHLVCAYDQVPIIDNLSSSLAKSHRLNTRESVWKYIVKKMELASDLLPEDVQKGRVSKWSAKSLLSRYYLFMAAMYSENGVRNKEYLEKARDIAQDVIEHGPYELMKDFEELFRTQNDNNTESIFALQWLYGAGYGYENTINNYYAFDSSITGNGQGWGGGHGATAYIMEKFFSRKETSRMRATYFVNGQKYDYIHQIVKDPDDPTKNIEVPLIYTKNNICNVKKGVVGLASDNNGEVGGGGTGLNTYKMRYSEVLLNYVEAVMALNGDVETTDALALKYFNVVRERANMPSVDKVTEDDLYSEREMEFTQERLMWYECVKRFYYKPEKLFNDLRVQNRTQQYEVETINANTFDYKLKVNKVQTIESESGITLDASRMFLPIPDYEKTMDPGLALEAVPYEFDNK